MILYAAMIEDPREQTRFDELYEGYRGQMYAVAYRVLKDRTLAEDAVHEAFLGVAMSMKTVPEGNGPELRAYLFTCAKHAAQNGSKWVSLSAGPFAYLPVRNCTAENKDYGFHSDGLSWKEVNCLQFMILCGQRAGGRRKS